MRRNSRKGAGGPKSAAGKGRSAQNARRHGLAVRASRDPKWAPEVEALAKVLAGPRAGAERLDVSREMADAHVDLRRIRIARSEVMRRPLVTPLPSTRDLIYASKRVTAIREGRVRVELTFDDAGEPLLDWRLVRTIHAVQNRVVDLRPAQALAMRSAELARLERYERRAFSRRSAAIRAFDALE